MVSDKLDCCTHHNGTNQYKKGYVLLPCFKILLCEDCNNIELICNNKLSWLFEHIFIYFWTGKIVIYEEGNE